MRLTIAGCEFELLGDPHLGRPFRNGVPLHRLGHREQLQRMAFQRSLKQAEATGVVAHVCMGDLFDKAKVDNRIVRQAAEDYQIAARTNRATTFFCLTGNHDEARDRDFVSSFQLFTMIVDDDMTVIRREPRLHYFEDRASQMICKAVFVPWHPLKTAAELIEDDPELFRDADVVFGHWDVDRRLEGTDNYIPAARLKELGVGVAVTGHDHVAREMELAGLRVVVTGSMQPYSHSEDPGGEIYVTLQTNEAAKILAGDPEAFSDNCLRVIGVWDDEIPNCLQFKAVPEGTVDADEALAQVEIAEFSMTDLWNQAFEGVDPEISGELRAKFSEIGGEDEA